MRLVSILYNDRKSCCVMSVGLLTFQAGKCRLVHAHDNIDGRFDKPLCIIYKILEAYISQRQLRTIAQAL